MGYTSTPERLKRSIFDLDCDWTLFILGVRGEELSTEMTNLTEAIFAFYNWVERHVEAGDWGSEGDGTTYLDLSDQYAQDLYQGLRNRHVIILERE